MSGKTGASAERTRSKFGQKVRDMVGKNRLSEEEIAIAALLAYNKDAQNPSVYNRIRSYAGGTLYLIEFTFKDGGGGDWSVLIRGSESQVFYDHEMALRETVLWNRKISAITFGSIVTASISISIVGAFLYYAIHDGGLPAHHLSTMRYRLCLVSGLGNQFLQVQPVNGIPLCRDFIWTVFL
jgi:hypothetical protein